MALAVQAAPQLLAINVAFPGNIDYPSLAAVKAMFDNGIPTHVSVPPAAAAGGAGGGEYVLRGFSGRRARHYTAHVAAGAAGEQWYCLNDDVLQQVSTLDGVVADCKRFGVAPTLLVFELQQGGAAAQEGGSGGQLGLGGGGGGVGGNSIAAHRMSQAGQLPQQHQPPQQQKSAAGQASSGQRGGGGDGGWTTAGRGGHCKRDAGAAADPWLTAA